MPQLSQASRDYPLSTTPEPSPVQANSSESFLGLGNKDKRAERKEMRQDRRAERRTNRSVRSSYGGGGGRCGRRGCPGQGSGMGFGGYN